MYISYFVTQYCRSESSRYHVIKYTELLKCNFQGKFLILVIESDFCTRNFPLEKCKHHCVILFAFIVLSHLQPRDAYKCMQC